MRYKVIAATLGATSLLAMGITAAAVSANSSYGIDGDGTAVTQGTDPTTMTSTSFVPAVRATPACGFMIECSY
jgi:hypothetical protein